MQAERWQFVKAHLATHLLLHHQLGSRSSLCFCAGCFACVWGQGGYRACRDPQPTRLFSSVLQRAAGGSSAVEFQLRLSLFDVAYHHFFGRTWRSSARTPRSAPQQRPRVVFNEVWGEHAFLGGLGCNMRPGERCSAGILT